MRRKIHRRKTHKRQRGGVLSTVVGQPLVYSNIGSWPGHGTGYYYSNNTNPYLQTTNYISERGMMGGYTYPSFFSKKSTYRKRKRRTFKRYGGSTLPLLNDLRLGAEVATSNVQNMINTSTGNPSQVSALPYMNQFHK
jgi:hypothetical protein